MADAQAPEGGYQVSDPRTTKEMWFEACGYRITPVEIDRYTRSSVWFRGSRYSRTGYRSFFPTWAEAHHHLMAKTEAELVSARRQLEYVQGRHGQVKGMRPPQPECDDCGADEHDGPCEQRP